MSRQTSIDSFFRSKSTPLPARKKNIMENNIKLKRRSLSLRKSPRTQKSLKKTNEMKDATEVISLSSSSEDLFSPIETAAPQHRTNHTSHNIHKISSSPHSAKSSTTIAYSISPNASRSLPRTPNKTPESQRSNERIFSPTKKRIITQKSPAKRNLCMQFSTENVEHNCDTNVFIHTQHSPKFQDDKTLFLLSVIVEYLKSDSLKHMLDVSSEDLLSRCTHLSEPAVRVVCRLYWRQQVWYRREELEQIARDKTTYSSPNMKEDLRSLIDSNFLTAAQVKGENSLNFDDYVKLLKKPDLQQICKELKLKIQSKQDAISALKKFSQETSISHFFTGKLGNNSNRVLNILRAKTGDCYRLSDLANRTLYNLYILMYLGIDYTIIREKRLELILLYDKLKKETYPVDKTMLLDKANIVFQNKDEFNSYLAAHVLYENYVNSDDAQEMCNLINKSFILYKNIKEEDMARYKSLPQWLRRFTPGYIYVKIMDSGVQVLKKSKLEAQYLCAVNILDLLIGQIVFRQHKKAEWFAEKALVLHKHLDRSEQAAKTLLEGFEVDFAEETKDAMRPRAKLIANQRNVVIDEELRQSLRGHAEQDHILECNLSANHIYKQPMDNHKQKGKLKFEAHTEEGRLILSAEDYCILHYTHEGGYTHGEHWEGRMVTTMFFLLFWDIIYTKPVGISGIFLSYYQRYPLDMYSENFYNNRKTLIDDRLIFIEECTDDMLVGMLQNRWEERPEYEVSDINRNIGWHNIETVARCLGARCVAAICRRLATNYGYAHSGFPDLTLWNVHTKQIQFVEVKTDGDKPSMKQIQWLQYLTSHKMAAGFCYVGVNTTRCKARSRATTMS